MPLDTPDQVIKVAPDSNVKKVAGAIAYSVADADTATVHAIGAGAVNQAVKSIAIARGMVASKGLDLWCRIGFTTVMHDTENKDISVMVFLLNTR
jgi:stage V sporulation protein S